jgi:hypothetical protein
MHLGIKQDNLGTMFGTEACMEVLTYNFPSFVGSYKYSCERMILDQCTFAIDFIFMSYSSFPSFGRARAHARAYYTVHSCQRAGIMSFGQLDAAAGLK